MTQLKRFVLAVALSAAPLMAQPHSITPVVLVSGWKDCGARDRDSFGNLSTLLNQGGTPTFVFNHCAYPNMKIEALGLALAQAINSQFGMTPVDIVAHSMGGLIARSYLSSVFEAWAARSPTEKDEPLPMLVRNLILIGTPNLGTDMARLWIADQTLEMTPGSPFLAWLNTPREWRTRVLAIAGIGSGSGDGVVALRSAAWGDAQTRVIPYCHTPIVPCGGLTGANGSIAYITDASHPTYQIVRSFLDGTDDWLSVGLTPTQAWLKHKGVSR